MRRFRFLAASAGIASVISFVTPSAALAGDYCGGVGHLEDRVNSATTDLSTGGAGEDACVTVLSTVGSTVCPLLPDKYLPNCIPLN